MEDHPHLSAAANIKTLSIRIKSLPKWPHCLYCTELCPFELLAVATPHSTWRDSHFNLDRLTSGLCLSVCEVPSGFTQSLQCE
jgi:hypothetical protein